MKNIIFCLLALYSISANASSIVFGGISGHNSEVDVAFDSPSTEYGFTVSGEFDDLDIKAQASNKTISNKVTVDYLYAEKVNGSNGYKVGVLNNQMGLMSEGLHNPYARYTAVLPTAIYWSSSKGIGTNVVGAGYSKHFSVGETEVMLNGHIGKTFLQTEESEEMFNIILKEWDYDAPIKFGQNFYADAMINQADDEYRFSVNVVEHSLKGKDDRLVLATGSWKHFLDSSETLVEVFYADVNPYTPQDVGEHGRGSYIGPSLGATALYNHYLRDDFSFYVGGSLLYFDVEDRHGNKFKGLNKRYTQHVRYNEEFFVGARTEITSQIGLVFEHRIQKGMTSNTFYHKDVRRLNKQLDGGLWHLTTASLVFSF